MRTLTLPLARRPPGTHSVKSPSELVVFRCRAADNRQRACQCHAEGTAPAGDGQNSALLERGVHWIRSCLGQGNLGLVRARITQMAQYADEDTEHRRAVSLHQDAFGGGASGGAMQPLIYGLANMSSSEMVLKRMQRRQSASDGRGRKSPPLMAVAISGSSPMALHHRDCGANSAAQQGPDRWTVAGPAFARWPHDGLSPLPIRHYAATPSMGVRLIGRRCIGSRMADEDAFHLPWWNSAPSGKPRRSTAPDARSDDEQERNDLQPQRARSIVSHVRHDVILGPHCGIPQKTVSQIRRYWPLNRRVPEGGLLFWHECALFTPLL